MGGLSLLLKHRSLLLSHILCTIVVFWVAWPALRQPRIEGDDYRYLHAIQQLEAGRSIGLIEAATVENRWDHLWFLDEGGRIRFFRPTVVASYGLDALVWGEHYEFGLILTNVLIHLACTLLVGFLLHRLLGYGLPAMISSVLFAGLWSHGECIWYIAGRTDSLAALGLLGAFALHAAGGKHPALRWWAIPFFVFGLLTKELVVAAPILLAVYDVFVERKRPSWRLYSVYALCTVAVLGLKQLALGGHSSDFVYPYLISPLRPDFMEHLWLQARSYSANLLLAQWTAPFADAGTVAAMNSLSGVVLVVVLLVFSGILLWRDGRFWLLFALGIATWLPTSFVYLSERYLYLPSFAFVGILGLLIATRAARWRMVLSVGLGFYATFHAVALHRKHMEICGQPGSLREMAAQLEPLRERIKPGARLLLINEPGPFLRAQFTEEILRVLLDDPKLSVQVLTMMPGQNGTRVLPGDPPPAMGAGIGLRRNGINKLLLQGLPRQAVQEQEHFPFAWASLTSGAVHRTPELEAHILQSRESVATGIEFILPEPLDDYQILVWEAGSTVTEHPWDRRSKATVRLVVW